MTLTEETTAAGTAGQAPIEELPVLPLREGVLFPGSIRPFNISLAPYVDLMLKLGEGSTVAVVSHRDPQVELPQIANLNVIGTRATVHKILRVREGLIVVFCQGTDRIRIHEFVQSEPHLVARVERLEEIPAPAEDPELQALQSNVVRVFQHVIADTPDLPDELQIMAANIPEASHLADFAAATMPGLSFPERQQLLEQLDVRTRLIQVNQFLEREMERIHLRQKIHTEAQGQLARAQREFFLREQLKAIQKELGEADVSQRDVEELRKKVDAAGMPPDVKKEVNRELDRLQQISPVSPEYATSRNYVDWMVSLPWSVSSGTSVDIAPAARILDEDHYGLEKVKERILDYLAVLQLRPSLKGPILCFVGAPGVGKTSLGKSIARALNRKFTRLSLGGMHDEAEIRGHRRTYIGALPGQIIQGLRRVGVNDPVFMLDEIDKLGHDFHGDPASALLEVLDPEQNHSFRDNYLDVPFDLSKVLFITTANQLEPVPPALRDRMEVIEIQGYSELEKLMIAKKYLIPRQARENGIELDRDVSFTDQAVYHLIRHYTSEAGVRNLERNIGAICRKQARRVAAGVRQHLAVTPAVVEEVLGAPRYRTEAEILERVRRPGVAVGLAWTPTGGDVLFIEAGRMPGGSKGLIMTGQLGAVMQESIQAALTWVRTHASQFEIDPKIFRTSDIHVHVPSGAIPKDGPSAGITIAVALLSALTGRCMRPGFGMTGEVTLTGLVLPVGAIKEKVLAAKRGGLTDVILPADNEVNVKEDLKPEHLEGVRLHYVRSMEQVAELALCPAGAAS
jgi:ATP-dependent Lon protease